MDEKKLINRARKGDKEAISQLYNEHKDKVFAFVYYRVGVQSDSEDLFQEVMLAAFDSLERFRGEVPFLHWCYQIARNKVAMFWRNKAKEGTVELHDNIILNEDEMELESKDDSSEAQRKIISKILDDLEPPRYGVFLMVKASRNVLMRLGSVKIMLRFFRIVLSRKPVN